MAQKITLTIAGKQYPLTAASPEIEQIMRIASDTINQKLAAYDAKFHNTSSEDKLAFVALNETVTRLTYSRKIQSLEAEIKKLHQQTESYLADIDKK